MDSRPPDKLPLASLESALSEALGGTMGSPRLSRLLDLVPAIAVEGTHVTSPEFVALAALAERLFAEGRESIILSKNNADVTLTSSA